MCLMLASSMGLCLESLFLSLGAAVSEDGSVCVMQTFVLLLSAFGSALSSFCYLLIIQLRAWECAGCLLLQWCAP